MIKSHSIPARLFDDLASARSTPVGVSFLNRTILSRNIQLAARLVQQNDGLIGAAELLSRVQTEQPAIATSMLTYPWVSNYLMTSVRAAAERRDHTYFRAIAVAAALRAGLTNDLRVVQDDDIIALPTLGILPGARRGDRRFATGPTALDGLLPVALLGAQGAHQPRVYLDDLDPFRDCHGYPLHDGALRASASDWADVVSAGLDLLCRSAPDRAAELCNVQLAIAPVRSGLMLSGVSVTSGDGFGGFAATVPSSPAEFAATLVHEFHHSKLNALHSLLPLFDSGDDRRFFAPWRVDPRPISGLLHGVYAFTAVADLWLRWRNVRDLERRATCTFAFLRAQIRQAIPDLLGATGLTEHGKRMAEALGRTAAELEAAQVPHRVEVEADQKLKILMDRWLVRGGADALPRRSRSYNGGVAA